MKRFNPLTFGLSSEKCIRRTNRAWNKVNQEWLRKSGLIALRVLARLRTMGMTPRELANHLGLSNQYVRNFLKGSAKLSLATIARLELLLHIHLMDIVLKDSEPVVNS